MQNEALYEERYRDCLIKIYQDENYDGGFYHDDDIFLVHYHRDLEVKNDKIITSEDLEKWYNGEKIEQEKNYFIFAVSAYIHSGISLSLNASFVGDSGGWDTSHVGAVLVTKKEAKTRAQAEKLARGCIQTWNDDLSGNVYGYMTTDPAGNSIDSVWGFYGDYQSSGIITEAESAIDYYLKNDWPKVQAEAKRAELYARHDVNLLDLSKNDDETVKRNAISLIKQLKIK